MGFFGISGVLVVPRGYVSGDPLSDTSIYSGATFATLGVTPGTYVWKWGEGATADSFTLQIGGGVPEPSTWAMMALGFAGIGFVGYRSSRKAIPLAA